MRVIGGSARRRQLKTPAVPGLRPTSDRVREAVFDILGSLGVVESATVLDAFAGSGALGIEAISRGAASVTFVDIDRRAIAGIRENLAATGLDGPHGTIERGGDGPTTRLVRADLLEYLARVPGTRFGVALVDPPYPFGDWAVLLELLDAEVAVLGSARPIDVPPRFTVRREYRYGGTLITLVEATGPSSADPRPTDKDPV